MYLSVDLIFEYGKVDWRVQNSFFIFVYKQANSLQKNLAKNFKIARVVEKNFHEHTDDQLTKLNMIIINQ